MLGLIPHITAIPIRVPLTIAIIYEGKPDLTHMGIGHHIAAEIVAFYRRAANLRIQPTVRGLILPPFGGNVNKALLTHTFDLAGVRPCLLVLSLEQSWTKEELWGSAYGGDLAVTVGNIAEYIPIAIHELGHIFNLDHDDNTFMHTHLEELYTRPVTNTQKLIMRRKAWELGGL